MTPARDITLAWPTFSDAAAQAGISRRYGGIHFEQTDLDARKTARLAAQRVWSRAQSYVGATSDRDREADAWLCSATRPGSSNRSSALDE